MRVELILEIERLRNEAHKKVDTDERHKQIDEVADVLLRVVDDLEE